MTSYGLIPDQWTCLTEPERSIANTMTDNLMLMLGQYIQKDAADAMFLAVRGADWQDYRDAWKKNWAIFETDIVIGPITVTVYATLSSFPTDIMLCRLGGDCGAVTTRCTAVTGVFH